MTWRSDAKPPHPPVEYEPEQSAEPRAEDILREFIGKLWHEHCSWDIPGGCDGTCDCHVASIQAAWSEFCADREAYADQRVREASAELRRLAAAVRRRPPMAPEEVAAWAERLAKDVCNAND